jgi:hypothetical protein
MPAMPHGPAGSHNDPARIPLAGSSAGFLMSFHSHPGSSRAAASATPHRGVPGGTLCATHRIETGPYQPFFTALTTGTRSCATVDASRSPRRTPSKRLLLHNCGISIPITGCFFAVSFTARFHHPAASLQVCSSGISCRPADETFCSPREFSIL